MKIELNHQTWYLTIANVDFKIWNAYHFKHKNMTLIIENGNITIANLTLNNKHIPIWNMQINF